MFYGNIPPPSPSVRLSWSCTAEVWAAALGSVYSCGELMRENCLWTGLNGTTSSSLSVDYSLHCAVGFAAWLEAQQTPGASADPRVPNRSRSINSSPISCGGLGSDVVRRTSVQGRGRTSEPGPAWLWASAKGRQALLRWFLPDLVNMDDDMRSYVFMWRVLVGGGGAVTGICILMQLFFLPYNHIIAWTAEVMWKLNLCILNYVDNWVFKDEPLPCLSFLNRSSWP